MEIKPGNGFVLISYSYIINLIERTEAYTSLFVYKWSKCSHHKRRKRVRGGGSEPLTPPHGPTATLPLPKNEKKAVKKGIFMRCFLQIKYFRFSSGLCIVFCHLSLVKVSNMYKQIPLS